MRCARGRSRGGLGGTTGTSGKIGGGPLEEEIKIIRDDRLLSRIECLEERVSQLEESLDCFATATDAQFQVILNIIGPDPPTTSEEEEEDGNGGRRGGRRRGGVPGGSGEGL